MAKKILRIVLRGALCVVLGVTLWAAGWLGYTGWWRAFFVASPETTFAPLVKEGALALREGMPVMVLEGTPEEMGRRHGELLGPILKRTMRPYFGMLYKTEEKVALARRRAALLEPSIPDEHRREMRALAAAADVPYEDVLLANLSCDLVVALHCSTVVASGEATGGGPLVFGRNLDFPGYGILDGASVIAVVRPAGKHAYVAPTWPGLVGIQSGMNDAGVAIADMVDMNASAPVVGVPHAFRMRAVLERCASADEGLEAIRGMPCAVTQNLMLCDARRSYALEIGPGRCAVREPEKGLLFATNNFVSKKAGGAAQEPYTCPRYRREREVASEAYGRIDALGARRIIASTSITFINMHAMVFVPAERTLLLSFGTSLSRASDRPYRKLALAGVFAHAAGSPLRAEDVPVEGIGPVTDLPRRFDEPAPEAAKARS